MRVCVRVCVCMCVVVRILFLCLCDLRRGKMHDAIIDYSVENTPHEHAPTIVHEHHIILYCII